MNNLFDVDNQNKKQMKIYGSINDFFSKIIELKDSGLLEKYFKFLKKVPNNAPFNNTLVFIQNPGCSYYATADQWGERFNRTIKSNVHPMIILFPFGPVDFVYDLNDTEGEEITDEKTLSWWREKGGTLDDKIIINTTKNLETLNIDFKRVAPREYLKTNSLTTGGFAERLSDQDLRIALHPRYSEASLESYGVLCHEIAHILLGHLGRIEIETKGGNKRKIEIAKDRKYIKHNIKELEAELVAWIVFNSMGIEKNSESYMASWLIKEGNVQQIEIVEVLKVAGKIQEMGKRKVF